MTSKLLNWPDWKKNAQVRHLHQPVAGREGDRQPASRRAAEDRRQIRPNAEASRSKRGQEIFRSLCFACHGFDGKGMPMPGREGVTLAPPLAGSQDGRAGRCRAARAVAGSRAARSTARPTKRRWSRWAPTTTSGSPTSPATCARPSATTARSSPRTTSKKLRAATKARTAAVDHRGTARRLSAAAGKPQGMEAHRQPQAEGSRQGHRRRRRHALEQQASRKRPACGSRSNSRRRPKSPAWCSTAASPPTIIRAATRSSSPTTAATWDKPILQGKGNNAVTELLFPKPAKTKFIRITQTGEAKGNFWSIHELQVLKPAAKSPGK